MDALISDICLDFRTLAVLCILFFVLGLYEGARISAIFRDAGHGFK